MPDDDSAKRWDWQTDHVPNMTGTAGAYRPPGHVLKGGARDGALVPVDRAVGPGVGLFSKRYWETFGPVLTPALMLIVVCESIQLQWLSEVPPPVI